MKKSKLLMITWIVTALLLVSMSVVVANPPDLPSGFYGEIHFIENDGGPGEGDTIEAYLPGSATPAAQASITTYETNLVYTIRVPGNIEDNKGDVVTFKIGTRIVASGIWNSGTNVNLDIHPPKANAGGPYESVAFQNVSLSGSATDWLTTDTFSYAWDLDNDGLYDNATGYNPTTSFSTAGIKTIGLKVTDSQGGEGFASTTVEVAKATAEVTLSDLTHTYDGSPKGAAATTVPTGLQVTFTYDGDEIEPTDAGTYAVVAAVVDDNYQGSAEGTLVIDPASASITLSDLDQDYDGNPKPVTVTTNPPNVVGYALTYDGTSTVPSATGAYAVAVTITDPNYTGDPASGTLVIRSTHNITLVPGWNLVSFNLQPYPSNAPGDVLESIFGVYDLVYAWDAAGGHVDSGHWMSFDDIPQTTDTLTELNEGMGFWIHITDSESQTLSLKGFMPDETNISLLTNASGWNMVGFPSASTSTTPTDSFVNIGTSVSLVYEYDPSNTISPWKIYDPDAPAYANDLESLRPGYGYWVLVTEDATWDVLY